RRHQLAPHIETEVVARLFWTAANSGVVLDAVVGEYPRRRRWQIRAGQKGVRERVIAPLRQVAILGVCDRRRVFQLDQRFQGATLLLDPSDLDVVWPVAGTPRAELLKHHPCGRTCTTVCVDIR